MEVEGHIPAAQPVIDGQRRGGQGPVGGVIRQGAEQGAVDEEARHVAQVADEGVAGDGVEVVKVEAVVEVVRVGSEDGGGKGRQKQSVRRWLGNGDTEYLVQTHFGLWIQVKRFVAAAGASP